MTIPSEEATLWSHLQGAARRAWDMWKDDLPLFIEGVGALADIGEMEKELRSQVIKLMVRIATSRDSLDPRIIAFLVETAGSSATRNRMFDALIASSPDRDE